MHITPFSKSGRSRQKFTAELRVIPLDSQTVRLLIQTEIDGSPSRCKLDLNIDESFAVQRMIEQARREAAILPAKQNG